MIIEYGVWSMSISISIIRSIITTSISRIMTGVVVVTEKKQNYNFYFISFAYSRLSLSF